MNVLSGRCREITSQLGLAYVGFTIPHIISLQLYKDECHKPMGIQAKSKFCTIKKM